MPAGSAALVFLMMRFFGSSLTSLWCHLLIGGLEHFLISPILGNLIPTDELIFFRGVGSTTNQYNIHKVCLPKIIPEMFLTLSGSKKISAIYRERNPINLGILEKGPHRSPEPWES